MNELHPFHKYRAFLIRILQVSSREGFKQAVRNATPHLRLRIIMVFDRDYDDSDGIAMPDRSDAIIVILVGEI